MLHPLGSARYIQKNTTYRRYTKTQSRRLRLLLLRGQRSSCTKDAVVFGPTCKRQWFKFFFLVKPNRSPKIQPQIFTEFSFTFTVLFRADKNVTCDDDKLEPVQNRDNRTPHFQTVFSATAYRPDPTKDVIKQAQAKGNRALSLGFGLFRLVRVHGDSTHISISTVMLHKRKNCESKQFSWFI